MDEQTNPREILRNLLKAKGITARTIAKMLDINAATIYNFIKEENPSQMGVDTYTLLIDTLKKLPNKT